MILQLNHVYKNYSRGKNEVPVLKDICLEVDKGEYLAIMGPSGSGKTTLMNMIGCLDVPTQGEYILDGRRIDALDDNALAEIRNKYIGFVFQNFYLLPKMTAQDNVALPLLYAGVPQKERRERAAEALKAVGLGERIHFLPNQLSGGQQQRVSIGRALINNPALMLADEPTGNLDSENSKEIVSLLRQFNKELNQTVIIITHDEKIALSADRIISIEDGKITRDEVRFK